MIKFCLTIANNPLVVLLSTLMGATAIAYLQATLIEALYWLLPVVMIIGADLITGINAAHFRKEEVRWSTALRRTMNKFFSYGCWIVTCVALNERYETELCAWVGMGIVFFIEGISFLTNLLEPHGIKLSIKGLLRVIGGKVKLENLEDVIDDEKK